MGGQLVVFASQFAVLVIYGLLILGALWFLRSTILSAARIIAHKDDPPTTQSPSQPQQGPTQL